MDWRHRAACRDEDPELFFPIGNTGPALDQIEEARAVCQCCEVVETRLQVTSAGSLATKVKNTNRSNPDASTVFGLQRAATNLK